MENINFKNKTALILDSGCYVEVAVRLGRDFGKVYYWSQWNHAYPSSYEKSIGKGLEDENVFRVDFYEDILKEISQEDLLIVIPEGNMGPIVEDLRSRGFRVWGGGSAEELEYDREAAKEYMEHLKLPVNPYIVINGTEDMKEYLMDPKNEDKFVKNDIRGSFESFHHQKWRLTEPLFDSIVKDLGATGRDFKFIVEDPIPDAVEYGYDGFCIDGKYPENTLFGVEVKDLGYLGVVKPMSMISKLITDSMYKIAPFLKAKKYRQTISSEVRITKDKKAYVIDWTQRMPSPPGEIYLEIWKNFSDIIWFGAEGMLIEPEFESQYAVEGIIQSSWAAGDGEQAIYFPEEIRRWVKIKNLYKSNNTYYFLPVDGGYTEIGGVVALGDSISECHKKLEKYAGMIEGYKIHIPVGSIDKAMEEIKKGSSLGITF